MQQTVDADEEGMGGGGKKAGRSTWVLLSREICHAVNSFHAHKLHRGNRDGFGCSIESVLVRAIPKRPTRCRHRHSFEWQFQSVQLVVDIATVLSGNSKAPNPQNVKVPTHYSCGAADFSSSFKMSDEKAVTKRELKTAAAWREGRRIEKACDARDDRHLLEVILDIPCFLPVT